ncbi:hypothetical protein [Streptomyces triticiradicis]|uniref:Alpha/beta hydrolase n=1 Tax=Streptomyces triticiradicis TaxID=2651189 RepID=A0A7J5D5Q1_9ACTN|nr:hypothetical protein [Streptomyces triticiradicis]KAB1979053.1 hypothetical protein F8144_37325 [Streptomyces triticiradicis]
MVTASGTWKTLTEGENSEGIVLAVDFDTTGRPEARFSDLVANMGSTFEVWESVPPNVAPGHSLSGADYVDHWAARLEAERPEVHAILGFCGGAVYASALAERIGRLQGFEPKLVVFDPELSTAQTLFWQFHKVIGFLSDTLSAPEIAEARSIGEEAFRRITEAVALKDELLRLMREFGMPALERIGLDETRREELFSVFDSFLCYLAAASEIDPRRQWRSAVAFNSTSALSGLNAMRSAGVEIEVGREITVEADHGTLLSDKDMAGAVVDLLKS